MLPKDIIFISAGNLGGVKIFPQPMRPFYTKINMSYHKGFEDLAEKYGSKYINLYQDPSIDPFTLNPNKYFAEDSFHPSSFGYEVWFNLIKENLEKK
mgnify:FL=1